MILLVVNINHNFWRCFQIWNNFVLEGSSVFFWNDWSGNECFISNFDCIDFGILWSLNCFFYYNIIWCRLNWNVSLSIDWSWINSLILDWNEILSVYSNSNFWFNNFDFFNFIVKYWLINLWNLLLWNVYFIINFDCVNFSWLLSLNYIFGSNIFSLNRFYWSINFTSNNNLIISCVSNWWICFSVNCNNMIVNRSWGDFYGFIQENWL